MGKLKEYKVTILKGSLPEMGLEYWTDKDWEEHNLYVEKLKETDEFLKPEEIQLSVTRDEMFDVSSVKNYTSPSISYRFDIIDFSKDLK